MCGRAIKNQRLPEAKQGIRVIDDGKCQNIQRIGCTRPRLQRRYRQQQL